MNRLPLRAIVAAILLVPSVVLATVVIAETIEEMTQASPVIVRGRVLQVQPQLEEASGRIYTYADLQVSEVLKGPRLTSILVKQPGGEIGNRGTAVAGTAKFKEGQDTVLFLEPAVDEQNVFIVHGLAAGKVDLEKSAKGELRALRKLDGLGFAVKGSLKPVVPDGDLGPPDTFLNRVRAAVTKGGAR